MGLLNDKVTERRRYLINSLNRRGITLSSDGRNLVDLPLDQLEMMNISIINDELRKEIIG